MAASTNSSSGFWTAALSGKSDKEKVELLDRMLTRFALCEDSKLQGLLAQIIPISIAALSSSSSLVRNKVVEILTHINRRVKNQVDVGLPLIELWTLHEESSAYPMIRSFCLMYIEMAIDRVSKKEKELIAPAFLSNISKLLPPQQDVLLRIAAKVIGECHASGVDDEILDKYRILIHSKDCEILLEFCLQTILHQPSSQSGISPGLSTLQCERVTGKALLNGTLLSNRKSGMLNVIEGLQLPPEHVYPIYVAACADSHEYVIKKGEELLKKISSTVNLDDQNLINRLFLLFNGTAASNNVAPESRVTPGSLALRLRLISVFCHSITAANSFPSTLQCIFGLIFGTDTTVKLKQSGMEFSVWVFKHAKMEQLKLMGPVILTGVMKMLDNSSTDSDVIVKSFCFQAIGLLAQRMPQLFRDKIDVAVLLFDALKLEDQSLRLTVQEATNSVAVAYKGASPQVLKDVELLLVQNYQMEQSEGRFCAIRWATLLFGLKHCPSRYICMLGAADSKLDIREMSLKGLFPDEEFKNGTHISRDYPKLSDMLAYIREQQPALFSGTGPSDAELLFSSKTYVAMIQFLLKCFEAEVGQTRSVSKPETETEVFFCLLLEHSLTPKGSAELHALASKALITVGTHFPQMIATRYAEKMSWLKQLLNHFDIDTRESAARLLGIASTELPISSLCHLISELTSSIGHKQNMRFEAKYGLLSALGYMTANCLLRNPPLSESVLQSVLVCLVDVINNETGALASVSMRALGHIGISNALPSLRIDSTEVSLWTALHGRLSKLLLGDDIKAIQRTVIALGHMSVKESSLSHLNTAVDLIFSLSRSKVEDILFAAGEALSFVWGGVPVTIDTILRTNYSSLSMTSNFLLENLSSSMPRLQSLEFQNDASYHTIVREAITRKLFDDLLCSTRKEDRCSGTVWLLSLTVYCGNHHSIQQLLPDIQEAFSRLVGDQNELTQELASQGLSIVYELGDSDMKKNLVSSLVGTLTGSGKRQRKVKLDENSEVFHEGAFGESPSGGKLRTYKELCDLANDVGQPDLIYKFMDLANHQASLNSKRGAAFGFSRIAKHAGDALQPYLQALVPKLFRYQYDPDANVQDAMAHIWKSLIADSKKTIDEHLGAIFEDLLLNTGSRLWRSREASCLALADVLQGRKFHEVKNHLERVWRAAFRAMDDIKETVRNAGDRLCRAVVSLTGRLCDISLTPIQEGREAMAIVLPLLLTEGILNKVGSIRKASIDMVMKLAKTAGIAIRPYLSDLVCCMLESLSSLEDQGMNYVEMHAERVGIQTDKLENLRISIARGSRMWETLEICVDAIDSPSLELLVPRLAQLIRSSIGLNTRVGVANFICLLVQKVGVDIKPFTSSLLKLLLSSVKDERSSVSKRAFANACALVLKHAAQSQAHKLIEDTVKLHAGDRNDQITCAILLKSYASTAADVLNGYHATVIPVIFVSRFEDEKSISSLYEELWEENLSSDRITLQLYMVEIVTLIKEEIGSSSWARKKKASQAVSKLCEVLGASLSSHHHILLSSLMKEIPGRLWEGKDLMLNALSVLCASCHESISASNPDAPNAILSLVTSACTKKEKKYREAAFNCLEQVIKAFAKPEFFNTVFSFLLEIGKSSIRSTSSQPSSVTSDKTEDDHEQDTSLSALHDKVLSCVTAAICVATIDDLLRQHKSLLDLYVFSLSPAFPWTVKVSVFASIKVLSSKMHSSFNNMQDPPPTEIPSSACELFYALAPKLLKCLHSIKIGQVHIAAAECLLELTNLYIVVPSAKGADAGFIDELLRLCEMEKNEAAKSLLRKCCDQLVHL